MQIRKYNFLDKIDSKNFRICIDNDNTLFYNTNFNNNPLSFLLNIFSLKHNYSAETYIAIEGETIIGLITTIAKRNNPNKRKITKLYLNEENLSDTGKALLNYVITKHSDKKTVTFKANITDSDRRTIDLFSKECGFRYCSDYKFYKIKTNYYKHKTPNTQNNIFRPYKPTDNKNVCELYNYNISPYYKFSLSKIPEEYNDTIFKGLNNRTFIRFIFEDRYTKKVKGYMQVSTQDNENYLLEMILLQSCENYFEDIIEFCISQIQNRTKNFNLYFKNCRFHLNSELFEKTLSEIDNEVIKTDMIFVKDFFINTNEEEKDKINSILYNEINGKPVYKI